MNRALLVGLVCVGTVPSAHAFNDYGFVIHMQQTLDLSDCDAPRSPQDDLLTCDRIWEIGSMASQQKAWVIAYGWETIPGFPAGSGIAGAMFGLEYDPSVSVVRWVLCTGGVQIPFQGWPSSGTGIAVTWGPGYHQPSGFARIGYLIVAPGSMGRMAVIAPNEDHPEALIASGLPVHLEFPVPPEGLSSADVGGTDPANAYKACTIPAVPVVDGSWGRIKGTYGD